MAGTDATNGTDFQDALSQLLGRLANPTLPSPLLQPGMPGGPPDTRGTMPVTARPAAVPFRPPQAPEALPPTPSDDPSITRTPVMPTLPTSPTFRSPGVLDARLADRARVAEINAAHANDKATYKPHWWDRLAGGALGALVGGATGNAAQGADAGGRVTHRAFNRAETARQRELRPLFDQLAADREDAPFYKMSDESAQRSFEDQRQNAVEERNQITASEKGETAKQLADIKQQIADNNLDMAQRKLDEASQKNQNDYDYHVELLKLRKEILDAREKKNERGTPAQFAGTEAKKAAALQKAKSVYDRETEEAGNDPELRKQAEANFKQAQRDSQSGYEAENAALGGTPTHSNWPDEAGSPSAQPPATSKAPKPGTPLTDRAKAKAYLQAAGGDREKARALAKADGWKF